MQSKKINMYSKKKGNIKWKEKHLELKVLQ